VIDTLSPRHALARAASDVMGCNHLEPYDLDLRVATYAAGAAVRSRSFAAVGTCPPSCSPCGKLGHALPRPMLSLWKVGTCPPTSHALPVESWDMPSHGTEQVRADRAAVRRRAECTCGPFSWPLRPRCQLALMRCGWPRESGRTDPALCAAGCSEQKTEHADGGMKNMRATQMAHLSCVWHLF